MMKNPVAVKILSLFGFLVFTLPVMSQTTLDQEIEELGLNVKNPNVDLTANAGDLVGSSGFKVLNGQQSGLVGNEIRVLLKPRTTTVLSAEISGQIRTLPFDIGDHFAKGDLLARIGCRAVFSEIGIAKIGLELSQIEYQSNKSLLAQGGVSKFDVEISGIRVQQSEANLKKWQGAAGDCSIHAPYGGKVVTRSISRYEHIGSGQPLLEIIDDSRFDMQLYVPSIWVTKLTKKTTFSVYIDEVSREYEAKVVRINPQVDAGSKTLEIIAQLEKHHKELRAGMSGSAKFDL